MIRTAFLGTSPAALPALEAMANLTDLRMVVTRPDRPRGRGRAPSMPPVKQRALELDMDVRQPATAQQLDSEMAPVSLDVAVVVAYGVRIPAQTLARPRAGMLNLHFSLLPRWRGAAPVERAILAGDPVTGVTLMQMAEGLDTGAVLSTWETTIGSDETAGELSDRLAVAASELLRESLGAAVAGELVPLRQDERLVTLAPRLSKEEFRLDFEAPAARITRTIRAFSPRPGAYTTWRGQRFKILRAREIPGSVGPGRIDTAGASVRVGTGRGCIELLSVQPAGSRSMRADDWMRGVRGDPGRFV